MLAVLVLGCVCPLSAQVQTSPTGKGVQPALPGSSGSGNSTSNVASANPNIAIPASLPSAAKETFPADVKTPATSAVKQNDKAKPDDSFTVGIADGLYISVWKEQDLSGLVVVRPDGMITVPVVGDVHVAGLTTPQVQDLLTEKLKDVVAEPQVTVIVRDIKSRKAYLVGKVGRPGAVELTSPETVLELLAEAGGPAQLAKPQKMYVLRTTDGKQKRIDFNYKKALAGSQPDLQVMVGDIIVVP
jgi:polysaccharide export outer membrane protein